MQEKIIVVGAGVGGLTAAHELVERDYEVHVFERREYLGGKAASGRLPRTNGRSGSPTEHGFRFVPGWYQHLRDTLKRIPYQAKPTLYQGGHVHDNLVDVPTSVLTWSNREPLALPLRVPLGLRDLNTALGSLRGFREIGFSVEDAAHFFSKLAAILIVPDRERERQFEGISFWNYLECETRSKAYQDFVRATTRNLIAAKAEEVSAYTMARLASRTFGDGLISVDSVFNGPTSEVWLDPWRAYLESRGVVFHFGQELVSLRFSDAIGAVESLAFESFATAQAGRLLDAMANVRYDLSVLAFDKEYPEDQLRSAARGLEDDVTQAQHLLENVGKLPEVAAEIAALTLHGAEQNLGELLVFLESHKKDFSEGKGAKNIPLLSHLDDLEPLLLAFQDRHPCVSHDANHFVFALPLEQMAYYVRRSPALQRLAPELSTLPALTGHMDWMAGIQFFLCEKPDLNGQTGTHCGHIVCLDSAWALTAIEETSCWHDVSWPSQVKAILSVDIANWHRRGRFLRKEPYNCTAEEIAEEVWQELKLQLNRRFPVLRDEMLMGACGPNGAFKPKRGVSFYLDDSIVDIHDRSKQALYEKGRAALALSEGAEARASSIDNEPDTFIWGRRELYNAEPLLINHTGTKALRPRAVTSIPNMFLAADYVRTETDLACMEGANEAARQAVNAILAATASDHKRCQLWSFSPIAALSPGSLSSSGLTAMTTVGTGIASAVRGAGRRLLETAGREIVRHREERTRAKGDYLP